MHRLVLSALAFGLLALSACTAAAQYPTPSITQLMVPPAGEASLQDAIILVAPYPPGDPNPTLRVGLFASCDPPLITFSLGHFPADLRPVQLAFRTIDGDVHHYGPAFTHSGPSSGFHSPELSDLEQIRHFFAEGLKFGTLVSNGFTSFYIEVPDGVLGPRVEALARCMGIDPP